MYETSRHNDKNWKIVEDQDINIEIQKQLQIAENEMEEQRQKIAEIEDNIKRVEDEKNLHKSEVARLEKKQNLVLKEIEQETEKWQSYLGQREIYRNRLSYNCDTLNELVNKEHQMRKLVQQKQLILSDIFKNTENFIISVDKQVLQNITSQSFQDEINMDLTQEIEEIERLRQQHKEDLSQLLEQFQIQQEKEDQIQQNIDSQERQAEINRVDEEEAEDKRKQIEKGKQNTMKIEQQE